MYLTNEDLKAIEDIMDRKLEEKLEVKLEEKLDVKLEEKVRPMVREEINTALYSFKSDMIENEIVPRIDESKQEMSDMIDRKLEPLKKEIHMIRVDLLENNVIPRLNTIENCYLSTYNRYAVNADKIESMSDDIAILKKVVGNHTEQIKRLSCNA